MNTGLLSVATPEGERATCRLGCMGAGHLACACAYPTTIQLFHRLGPLGRVSLLVAMSVRMLLNVCPLPSKFITSGCRGDLWSKNIFLILDCDDTIIKKRGFRFCTLWSLFLRPLKHTILEEPTVENGGVIKGRSVAVAVGCWLLALQRHINGTSTALQRHFNSTIGIGASICIGRESQCLPYAGFFSECCLPLKFLTQQLY